jgi:hypothetical protein
MHCVTDMDGLLMSNQPVFHFISSGFWRIDGEPSLVQFAGFTDAK